jgi:hypothetical protein
LDTGGPGGGRRDTEHDEHQKHGKGRHICIIADPATRRIPTATDPDSP